MKSLEQRKHEIIFQSRMNIHYHTTSENVFLTINNLSNFFSVLLGSATIASLSDLIPKSAIDYKSMMVIGCALIVTILNGVVLSFNISIRASEHRELRRRWHEVFVKIDSLSVSNGKEPEITHALDTIEKEMAKINGDEPPPNKKRLDKAYAATCISLGLESKKCASC